MSEARSSPAFAAAPSPLLWGLSQERIAWLSGLAADARAVLDAFRPELDAGTALKPAQYAALRRLEAAFDASPDPVVVTFRRDPCRPPGSPRCPPRPAADLSFGEARYGHAIGRPGL